MTFRIQLFGDIEKDEFVFEVYFDEELVCDLIDEGSSIRINIYPRPNGYWTFSLDSFLEAISAVNFRILKDRN